MSEWDGFTTVLNNADKIGVVALLMLLVLAFVREWVMVGRTVRRALTQQEAETRAQIAREQKLADERVAREQAYAQERLNREREITEQIRRTNEDILTANREIVRQQDALMGSMELVIDLVRALPTQRDGAPREQAGG